jgi:sugar-specific transcriptional regulator TrmB
MNRDSVTNFLIENGLKEKEISIYCFIARSGPQRATVIAEKLKMHKIQVYRCLQEMEHRGIVQQVFESPRRYVAAPIENLINERMATLKEKLENLQIQKNTISDQWKTYLSKFENQKEEKFAVIQGEEKLRSAIEVLRRRAKKELCTLITPEALVRVNLQGDHDRIMKGKTRFKFRVLTLNREKELVNFKMVIKRLLSSPKVEVHYLSSEIKPFPAFGITEDEVVLITNRGFELDFPSLWTNNEIIVSLIKNYFEELWDDAIVATP